MEFNIFKGSGILDKNNVINLNDYRDMKIKEKQNNIDKINNLKKVDEDDRRNTFNLFMRVLATMRKESY